MWHSKQNGILHMQLIFGVRKFTHTYTHRHNIHIFHEGHGFKAFWENFPLAVESVGSGSTVGFCIINLYYLALGMISGRTKNNAKDSVDVSLWHMSNDERISCFNILSYIFFLFLFFFRSRPNITKHWSIEH